MSEVIVPQEIEVEDASNKVVAVPEPNRELASNKVVAVPAPQDPSSKALDDIYLAQAAAIDSYLTGTDVGENFDKYSRVFNPKQDAERLSKLKATEDATAVVRKVEDNPYVGGQSIATNLTAGAIAQRQALVDGNNIDRQYIESISTEEGLALVEENTAKMELQKLLVEAESEVSTGEHIAGFLGNVLPFVETITQSALTGTFIIGRQEALQSAMVKFKNKPIEEQARIAPALLDMLIDYQGKSAGTATFSKFINAGGEYQTGDFHAANSLFDLADVAGFAKAGQLYLKSRSTIKTLKEAGDAVTASRANVIAMSDEDVAESLGTTVDSAVSTALPFKMDSLDLNSTDDLSVESIERIKAFYQMSDDTTDGIISGSSFVREGLLDTEDRALAEAEAMLKLANAKHENLRVLERGDDFTVFAYDARGADGKMLPETHSLSLDLDAAQDWKEADLNVGFPGATSPTVWLQGTAKRAAAQAQRLDFATPAVEKQLAEVMKEALSSLGSIANPKTHKRRHAVDRALIAGDEYVDEATQARGIVFSPEVLHDTYGLDEAGMEAYYKVNKAFQDTWAIANQAKRREMAILKYKGITMNTGESTYGKVQDSVKAAEESLRKGEIRYIYDDVEGTVIRNGGAEGWLEAHYDNNKVLINLDTPYRTLDAAVGDVKYILVDRSSVGAIPDEVITKNVGYVTRFDEDAAYFVKQHIPQNIDGQASSYPKTLRFFNNKPDADRYVKILEEADIEQGVSIKVGSGPKYSALGDREAESFSNITGDFSHGRSGLYTGTRSEDAILFGLNGDKSQRINSFQALAKNISAVAKVTTLNEWRMGLEQKWINTANRHLKEIGEQGRVESFGGVPEIMRNTEAGEALLQMELIIREWQGYASAAETTWKGTTQRMMNWAAKHGAHESIIKGIGSMKSIDPIARAKSVAFHSLLGSFNPAHFWIQAQGAQIALSLAAGKYATKVVRNVGAFTYIGEGVVRSDKVIPMASKLSSYDAGEFEAMWKLWKKSTMGDTVTQTADHAAALKGYGITAQVVKKVLSSGLFFYRNGELINRRTSFLTAMERYKEANNLTSVKGLGDAELKVIMADANNMMLNMGKSNKAGYQKGVYSLGTQFLKVTTSSLETGLGMNGHFTKAERGRMVTGQIAMYGTAGVPLIAFPIMYAMEVMGITQEELKANPIKTKALTDGFWGAFSYWAVGEDMEVSSRGSLLRGITDLADRVMNSDSPVTEALLGAFGSTQVSFWTEWAKQVKDVTMSAHGSTVLDIVEIPFLSVLATISTFSNIEKAVIMNRRDQIQTKAGATVVSKDFNWKAELMTVVGFRTAIESEPYTLDQRTKALKSVNKKMADYAYLIQQEFALKAETVGVTAADRKVLHDNLAFIEQTADGPLARQEIRAIIDRKYKASTVQNSARNRYIDASNGKLMDGMSSLKDAVLGTSLIILEDTEGN